MRTTPGAFIILAVMLLLDTYIFQAIKAVSQSAPPKVKMIIYSVYWLFTLLAVASFLLFVFGNPDFLGKNSRPICLPP